MNRRSVLGMLGLGAAAGPKVAQEAMLANPSFLGPPLSGPPLSSPPQKEFNEHDYIKEETGYIQKSISKMLKDKAGWISDYERKIYNQLRAQPRCDVDILALKSFSDVAKLKLQAKREAERAYDDEHQHLLDRNNMLMVRLAHITKVL